MSKLDLGPLALKDTSKEYIWRNQVALSATGNEQFTDELVSESYNSVAELFENENLYLAPFPNFIFDGKSTCLNPKELLTLQEVKYSLSEGKDVVLFTPKVTEEGLKFTGKVF